MHYIGKESTKIEEAASGLVRDLNDALTEYREQDPLWRLVVSALRELPVKQVAAGAGVSEQTVKKARAGKLTGTTARAVEVRAQLTDYAIKNARAAFRAVSIPRPPDREALLAAYLHHVDESEPAPADAQKPICPELRERSEVVWPGCFETAIESRGICGR